MLLEAAAIFLLAIQDRARVLAATKPTHAEISGLQKPYLDVYGTA